MIRLHRPTKKQVLLIGIVPIAMMIAASASLLMRLGRPSTGTVTVGIDTGTMDLQTTNPTPLSTTYYATTLPAGFEIRTQSETPANPLRLSNVLATGGDKKQISLAIAVGKLPQAGLRDVGNYNLRATQTSAYSRTVLPGQPAGAESFRTNNGKAGLTMYWPAGDNYYELAITSDGGDSYEKLLPIYAHLVANWQNK